MRLLPSAVFVALLVALGTSCQHAVLQAVPEPLPEALPWSSESEATGAFLGLRTTENDSGSLEDLFFAPGVRVVEVIENSPAASAGVQVRDVVLSIDGREIDDPGALDAWLARAEAGREVSLAVQREDAVFDVRATLDGRSGGVPEPDVLYRLDPSRSGAGWATDAGGVRLVSMNDASPFRRAKIPVGTLVTAIDGEDVLSDRELIRRLNAMDEGSEVEFALILPDGTERTKELDLLEAPTYLAGYSIPVLSTYSHDPVKDETSFVLIDLWIISLLRYQREGEERTWKLLRFFSYSSGVGELSE